MPPVDRRTFLAACATVLVAAGCTSEHPPDPEPTPTGHDEGVRDAVAESERALLAGYDEVIAEHPGLADHLAPLRAHHEAHLAGIGRAGALPGSPTPSTAPATPSIATHRPSTAPAAPRTASAALAALAAAERRAQRQRSRACRDARDVALVRTLALVAGSEAQHAEVLDDLAREKGRR